MTLKGLVLCYPNFIEYPHQAAQAIWEQSSCRSAANGGVMRTSVIGLWELQHPDKITCNAETVCRITHADPRCIGSCVIVSTLINKLVIGTPINSTLLNEIMAIAKQYDERIKPFLELAITADDIAMLELDDASCAGYTLKTLAAGLWALHHANSFAQGLTAVIMEGGDADTNGAVAGALLGARFGLSSIPKYWIEDLTWKRYLHRVSRELLAKIPITYINSINQTSCQTTSIEDTAINIKPIYLLILDDNQQRLEAFKQISQQLTEHIAIVTWLNAPSMLLEIDRYLPQAVLISLDHDLYRQVPNDPSPGCGRDVVNYLAKCTPACPVIIHSSNTDAAWGMYNELHFAGWQVEVKGYYECDDWYSNNWLPLVKTMLKLIR